MLADFLNTENGIVVNLHVQAIDQSEAIKMVKRKITDLDAMKIPGAVGGTGKANRYGRGQKGHHRQCPLCL